jgi:hypothetical protein
MESVVSFRKDHAVGADYAWMYGNTRGYAGFHQQAGVHKVEIYSYTGSLQNIAIIMWDYQD